MFNKFMRYTPYILTASMLIVLIELIVLWSKVLAVLGR